MYRYVEAFCPFVKEIAIMVARDREGNCVSYPVVHTIQKDNICHTVRSRVLERARER